MEDLRNSAKKYVEEIYLNHRQEDVEAWNRLIDILFDYIAISIKTHEDKDV